MQADVSPSPSCLRLSSGFPSPSIISVHRLPIDFVAFPLVVFLLGGSPVLYSRELFVSSSWRVTTTWCCLLSWLHVYSPSNFFVSDLVHSGISCSFELRSLLLSTSAFLCWWGSSFHSGKDKVELGWIPLLYSVCGLAKKVAGHQGLQLQKVVGPDEKL